MKKRMADFAYHLGSVFGCLCAKDIEEELIKKGVSKLEIEACMSAMEPIIQTYYKEKYKKEE